MPALPDTSFLVNGFKPNVAAASPQDVMAFKQSQALGAQQLQEGGLALQQKQIDMSSDQATRDLFAKHATAGTEPTDADIMSAAGPKVGTGIVKARLEAKDTAAKLQKTQGDLAEQEHDAMGAQGALIASRGYTTEAFADAMKTGTQLGYGAHLAPMIAAVQKDPSLIKQYADGMITVSKEQQKQRAAQGTTDSRILTAKTGQIKEDAELGGQQAESAAKVQTQELTDANQKLRAAGSDPKAYALAYGDLKGRVASQFTPPGQFDPATTPGLNDRVLMKPEERTQADIKGKEMDETALRDKNTAANQAEERRQSDKQIALKQQEVGIAQKRFNATLGQGLDANGKPLSPEDRKNAALSDPTAVAMANYQIPPPSNRTTALGNAQYAKVLAINPDFNGDMFADRHKINLDYGPSGATGKSMISTDTALSHVATVRDAGRGLKTNDLPMLNKLAQSVGVQTGSSAPVVYDAILEMVAPEISKAVIGAAGGVEDRKAIKTSLSRDKNDAQREGALGGIANLLGARYHKQVQAYESPAGMGQHFKGKLSPESQGVLDGYSGAVGGSAQGGGGKIIVTAPDGSTHPFDNQAAADRFKKLAPGSK